MIRISSCFDSGAIEVNSISPDGDSARLDLRIRRDTHQDFTQWFHLRLSGARGVACAIRFVNAAQCTYPGGWEGYSVAASYDRVDWFRVPTTYANGVMTVDFTPTRDTLFLAYFEPYDWERHLTFLGRAAASPRVRVTPLGTTHDGRDIDCVDLSSAPDAADRSTATKKQVWVIARQHPGETMAEWFVEGLIERLIDESRSPRARNGVVARGLPYRGEHESRRQRARQPADECDAAPTSIASGWPRRCERQPRSVPGPRADESRPVSISSSMRTATKRLPLQLRRRQRDAAPLHRPSTPRAERLSSTCFKASRVRTSRISMDIHRRQQVFERRVEARVEVGRASLRMPVVDARDAVQGQRRCARSRGSAGTARAASGLGEAILLPMLCEPARRARVTARRRVALRLPRQCAWSNCHANVN